MIEVKNLKKDFGKRGEIKVLRGITETIEKGRYNRPLRIGKKHVSALPQPS